MAKNEFMLLKLLQLCVWGGGGGGGGGGKRRMKFKPFTATDVTSSLSSHLYEFLDQCHSFDELGLSAQLSHNPVLYLWK